MDLRVDWASHDAAKYAVQHWHYSRTLPVPPIVKIGVWEDQLFVGVVLFSRGASSNLLKPYGLKQSEGCELTRIALSNLHVSPVTQIIKRAIALLRENSPDLRLIVSFADPHYGHHGGIYQAANWIYAGTTNASKEYWHKGKRLHSRQVSERGFNIQQGQLRRTVKPSECTIVETPGKHRYLWPLDKRMRRQVESLSQPYPRPIGVEGNTTGDQPGAARSSRASGFEV
jgi:hypothetical protein